MAQAVGAAEKTPGFTHAGIRRLRRATLAASASLLAPIPDPFALDARFHFASKVFGTHPKREGNIEVSSPSTTGRHPPHQD